MATDDDETISATQAGKILGVSDRQIRRYQDDGTLTKQARGRLLREEVEALSDQRGLDGASERGDMHLDTVLKSYTQAVQHVQVMFDKTQKAQEEVLGYYQKQLESASKREEMLTAKTLETMTVLGDLLMQRDERQALSEWSKARVETMGKVASVAVDELPRLMRQVAGGSKVEAVSRFAASLTPDQKEGLASLHEAFEGEQKEQYAALMRLLGIEIVQRVKVPTDE